MNFEGLNEQQFEAITDTLDNNVITVAGAGSGKTRVLTERIAYLIEGHEVAPENIMAVTFTRKASNEMRERVEKTVGYSAGLWIGTFHSICIKLLKKFHSYIGLDKNFTVLNEFTAKNVLSNVLQKFCIEPDKENIDFYTGYISKSKSNCVSPKKRMETASTNEELIDAKVYSQYLRDCLSNHSLDYDDLIIYTIKLFEVPQVSEWLNENIKYLLVDEYQDVNHAQYLLIKRIVSNNTTNLFVVGDHKQSIYGFRYSNPKYLENFEKMFDNTKVMYLDRNYRSTKTIVNASNSLIEKNANKFDVKCFTENEDGEKIKVRECLNPQDEASYIVNEIIEKSKKGIDYSDIAILFRNNSQSAYLEEQLIKNSIPYYVHNGYSFFERAEVKSMLAFLRFSINVNDVEAFQRAIRVFDGIGKKSIDEIIMASDSCCMNYYVGFTEYVENKIANSKSKSSATIDRLKYALDVFTNIALMENEPIGNILKYIFEATKYEDKLTKNFDRKSNSEKQKAENKIANIKELINISNNISEKYPGISIEDYLKQTEEINNEDLDSGKIKLISIHSSKGLEYEIVFICGVEQDILPSFLNSSTEEEIAEERRLFYVAMTRAKKELYITYCRERNRNDKRYVVDPSEFIDEIDEEYLEYV